MKKLRVISMTDQRDILLQGLQRLGCVEISEPDGLLSDSEWTGVFQRSDSGQIEMKNEIADVHSAMKIIKNYTQIKDSVFTPRRSLSEEDFLSQETAEKARKSCQTVHKLQSRLSQLRSEEDQLQSEIQFIQPWKSLDLQLDEIETAHTVCRFGVCLKSTNTETIRGEMDATEIAAEIYEINRDKMQVYYLLICHKDDESTAQDLLRRYGFRAVTFHASIGTLEEQLQKLDQTLTENRAEQESTVKEIIGEAVHREALKIYADRLQAEASKAQNARRILESEKILFFQGWIPAEKEKDVKIFLEQNDCAWEAVDPTEEEYPEVPVQFKNNWFTRPLNMVTDMYVMPAYDGVDPNPLMAPFFITFYGLMMADMGYGLLMLVGAWILLKKMHAKGAMRNFGGLLGLCGVSTLIWGAMTGSFFGDFIPQLLKLINPASTFQLPYLFTPLTDTLMILVGALILGMIQILTGMAISVVKKVKNGQVMDAIWDECTWWVILAGAALAILKIGNVGGYPVVLLLGIAMLVMGSMIRGKGFGKVTGLIGAIYNGVTGYFSDTLSYARLMALMLAGSVISQVFNTLGAVTGNVVGFVLVSLIGNLLNFALNLLGCYVHDLRLQCLEFFGRFYKEGGRPFRPLEMQTEFVDILDQNEGEDRYASFF